MRNRILAFLLTLGLLAAALPPVRVSAAPSVNDVVRIVTCDTSVLINFNTSVPARAYIDYGTSASYGSSTIDDPVRYYSEHAIPITGLTANTEYHYRITAIGGGTTQTSDATFTTAVNGTNCPAQPIQVDTRMPDMTGASNKTVKNSGGDYTPAQFQTALNDAATAAEKRYITVDAGLTLTGPYTLPAKSGTNWVIIRSSAHASLPAEGVRVGPSDASNMFKIDSASVDPPLITSGISAYWRLIGVEVTVQDSALSDVNTAQGGMIIVGIDTSDSANMPHHFVFDRVYVHGLENRSTARGIYLRAAEDSAVIDSYISNIHSTGQDSQAILALATKRTKIINNYLEGAGENFMWGGDSLCCPGYEVGDMTFSYNYSPWLLTWKMDHASFGTFTITSVDTGADTLTSNNHKLPANHVIRVTSTGSLPSPLQSATTLTNYFVRNPTANTFQLATTSGGSPIDLTTAGSGTIKGGIDYVKKNNFELKTSARLLMVGNLFENMWGPDQDTALNFKLERNSCRTFTVNTGSDVITGSGSPPVEDGQQVRLQNTGGGLPAPFSDSTTYYARDIAGSTFKLAATQGGTAIDITSTGTGTHRYEYVFELLKDLTYFRNHQRNAGMSVVIQISLNGNGCPIGYRPGSEFGARLWFLHSIFESDAQTWTDDWDGGMRSARAVYISGGGLDTTARQADSLRFDHNTFVNAHPPTNPDDSDSGTGGHILLFDPDISSGTKGANFVWTNNIVGHREFGIFSSGVGTGTTALNSQFTGYTWNKNMVVKNTQTHPETSLYVSNWTNAKFVSFNDGRSGNYRLASDSPGKAAGTDSLDVGADIAALERATESTIDGNWPTTASGTGGGKGRGKGHIKGKAIFR